MKILITSLSLGRSCNQFTSKTSSTLIRRAPATIGQVAVGDVKYKKLSVF